MITGFSRTRRTKRMGTTRRFGFLVSRASGSWTERTSENARFRLGPSRRRNRAVGWKAVSRQIEGWLNVRRSC